MTNLIALPDGTELVGDYRIERVLGAGGFGITYLADELALHRRVTIKEYFPSDFAARANSIDASPRSQDSAGDYRWGLDRFIEEAQTLAKFNHPHIVRVYRYFKANNTAYMVLHFEEGQSFKGWLKGLGRAPRQKELDQILDPLLQALQLIHAADFLHRDIAPDNIIIRKDGAPVLIDFGSARREIASHSKTVSALVKPGYSPYEQYAETSRQQGPWTDIYALGATLYHAVTGRRPPDAPSRMISDEYVPAANAALSSYRPRFLRAIDSALALNVDARPRSIAAWRAELLAADDKPAARSWLSRGRGSKSTAANPSPDLAPAGEPVTGAAGGDQPQAQASPERADKPTKQTPLTEALAKASAEAPAKQPSQPKAKAGAASEPAAASPAKDAQKPLPKTVKVGTAPAPLFAKKAGKGTAEKAPAEKAPAKKAPARKASAKKPSAQAAKAQSNQERDGVAAAAPMPAMPAPAMIEARKPARPRANRAGQSKWQSFLAKVILIGGLGTGVVAARDQFPPLEALLPALATDTATGSRAANPLMARQQQQPTTTASLQRPQAPPANPLISRISAHTGAVTALSYASDGRSFVSAGADATIRIWTTSGTLVRIIPMDHGAATTIALQGDHVATGHSDGFVAVWDMTSGRKLADMRRNEASVWSLAFTDMPGRLLAAGHDWKVSLWDLRTPATPVHVFEGHENAVQAVAFSKHGPYLASGGADRTVRLWNLNTLDQVRTYTRHPDFVTAVSISPDGALVAAATLNGDIRVWSATSQRNYRRLRGHKQNVTSVAFSPDSRMLASASADGTVRLWDVARSRTLRTLASHPGNVTGVDFAPDGSRMITGGDDGSIRIWSVAEQSAIR